MLSYKEKTKMICLKCSFRNNDSKNFCAKCGNNLKEYVAEPSVEIQPEQYFQHGPEVIDDKATGFITSRINERKTLYSDMPPECCIVEATSCQLHSHPVLCMRSAFLSGCTWRLYDRGYWTRRLYLHQRSGCS